MHRLGKYILVVGMYYVYQTGSFNPTKMSTFIWIERLEWYLYFSNFSCMFLNPNNFLKFQL